MPPQMKADLNRSGWESTDFPSLCENCLPDNPYVRMLKEDYGQECKLCTRPFTVFSWQVDRARGRKKRTAICLTCARLKNACQCCILDLQFGLPIVIRDKALQLIAPGPQSDVNREYFAQNNEKLVEDGGAGTELLAASNTDAKARDLLRRLATSKPYFRKGRAVDATEREGNPFTVRGDVATGAAGLGGPGPIRSRDSRAAFHAGRRPGGPARTGGAPVRAVLPPPGPRDWLPPADPMVMSLFVTGVEDDLAEFKMRDFFKTFGKIRSLVVSHMSHCAFVNYESREAAERAAEACKGRAVIAGCPLRVRWGQPKAIGTMNKEQRGDMLRDGRGAFPEARKSAAGGVQGPQTMDGVKNAASGDIDKLTAQTIVAPPGAADVHYASLAGD